MQKMRGELRQHRTSVLPDLASPCRSNCGTGPTRQAPRGDEEEWRHRDIRADIQAQCEFPVYLQNDATSLRRRSCSARRVRRETCYFYIGLAGAASCERSVLRPDRQCRRAGFMPCPTGWQASPADRRGIDRHAGKALNARGVDESVDLA
jgi:hypothetical protein